VLTTKIVIAESLVRLAVVRAVPVPGIIPLAAHKMVERTSDGRGWDCHDRTDRRRPIAASIERVSGWGDGRTEAPTGTRRNGVSNKRRRIGHKV
jgi:hypothetical protein